MPLWFLFSLPMLYHIVVEDLLGKQGWPLHDWLPEISVLCCMVSLLCASLGMRRHIPAEGEYVRRFGDRSDGRRVRSLSPIFAVSPYIMKTRNTSQNFLEDTLEVTNLERYIQEKRQAGLEASACSTPCWRPMCAPAPSTPGSTASSPGRRSTPGTGKSR